MTVAALRPRHSRRRAAAWWLLATVVVAGCREEPAYRRLPPRPATLDEEASALAAASTDTDSDLLELLRRRSERRAAELAAAPTAVALGRPATAELLPEDVTQSSDVLVWRAEGGRIHTWWLQTSAGTLQVVSDRAGLWLAGRDDVYAWQVTPRAVPVCDAAVCAAEEGRCQPRAVPVGSNAGRVDVAELRGLVHGKRVAVGAAVASSLALDLGAAGLQRAWIALGQFDRDLLVRTALQTSGCGPLRASTVFDDAMVRSASGVLQPLAVATVDDPVLAADAEAARQALQSGPQGVAGVLQFRAAHLQLAASAAAAPRGADGHAQPLWQVQFEFAVVDASGVTLREARLPAQHLPPTWHDALAAAPDVRACLPRLQLPKSKGSPSAGAGESHAGWSWLYMPAAERAQLRTLFALAPPRSK